MGIEIKLSGNHTCLGNDGKPHPFYDICDELQGRYPKDFKFTGWHPHCRCFATPILKTWEEMAADDERILNGEEPTTESVNAVRDMPDKFKQWTQANQERIDRAKSLPYFIKDNGRYFEANTQSKILSLSEQRHSKRTADNIQRIQQAWDERRARLSVGASGGIMTDDEARNTFVDFARKHHIDIAKQEVLTENGFVHLQGNQHEYLYNALKPETNAERNQIAAHSVNGIQNAGGYIGTKNCNKINNVARDNDIIGKIDAKMEKLLLKKGLTADDIKTMKVLDKKTSEFSLPFPIVVTRNIDRDALPKIFGEKLFKDIDFDNADIATLKTVLDSNKNIIMTADKGYMSVSTNKDFNIFKRREISMRIEIPAGTPFYLSDNFEESEAILGRGTGLDYLKCFDVISSFDPNYRVLEILCRITRG